MLAHLLLVELAIAHEQSAFNGAGWQRPGEYHGCRAATGAATCQVGP